MDLSPQSEEFPGQCTKCSHRADLLLYDGQFTVKDSVAKRGFGHSTAEKGVELMECSGAKRLLLIHHDPQASDEELLCRERRFNSERIRYAREGEEIEI